MNRIVPAFLVLATLLAAGCIELPSEVDSARSSSRFLDAGMLPLQTGTMSAEERVEEDERLCLPYGPVTFPDLSIYCATRTTTVSGDMTLTSLPYEVLTDTGDIEIVPSEGDVWSLVFTVTAAGSTQRGASARLDDTEVSWSINGPNGHHLTARAVHADENAMTRNDVHIRLALPQGALYAGSVMASTGDVTVSGFRFQTLTVSTSTGDQDVTDVRAALLEATSSTGDIDIVGAFEALRAAASTGDITLTAEVIDARASTSTGDIAAELTPTASGTIVMTASTGDVDLALPENARHGYRLEADTSTGTITIGLQDGEATISEDEDRATFTTNDFARRAIGTTVTIGTSTGDITVTPA